VGCGGHWTPFWATQVLKNIIQGARRRKPFFLSGHGKGPAMRIWIAKGPCPKSASRTGGFVFDFSRSSAGLGCRAAMASWKTTTVCFFFFFLKSRKRLGKDRFSPKISGGRNLARAWGPEAGFGKSWEKTNCQGPSAGWGMPGKKFPSLAVLTAAKKGFVPPGKIPEVFCFRSKAPFEVFFEEGGTLKN